MNRHQSLFVSFVIIVAFIGLVSLQAGGSVRAKEVLAILDSVPTSSDVLVERAVPMRIPLVENSHRLLYEAETERHWVSMSSTGDVCLTSLYEPNVLDWAAATTCLEPEGFRKYGLHLSGLGTPDGGTDVTLLPDGAASAGVRASIERAGGTISADNLVVFNFGERPHKLDVTDQSGRVFELGIPPDQP